MTDCPNAEVRDLLPELAAGTIAPEARASVEAHLADCAECRSELALLEAIRRSFARPVAIDVARVAAALPAPSVGGAATAGRRGFRAARWQIAAVVSLFAVGAASVWAVRQGDGRGIVVDSIGSMADGQERAVTLGHRLADLSEQDLEALLGALDEIDALPSLDPTPIITPLDGGEGS